MFGAWNWRFHHGLRQIERAYGSSRADSEADIAAIHEAYEKHEKLVQAGKAVWVQLDDDGQPEFDYGESLGDDIYEAEQVLALVRAAFLIALFHFVEQQIGPRACNDAYRHAEVVTWLKTFGATPDENALLDLQLTANVAKHSAGKSATELFKRRPDLFDLSAIAQGAEPSYGILVLTDQIVSDFFKTVEDAVPKGKSIFGHA